MNSFQAIRDAKLKAVTGSVTINVSRETGTLFKEETGRKSFARLSYLHLYEPLNSRLRISGVRVLRGVVAWIFEQSLQPIRIRTIAK